MEYMKNYNFDLAYHISKANVVTNALSQKSYLASMITIREWKLLEDGSDAMFRVSRKEGSTFVTSLLVMPRLYHCVIVAK